MNYIKIVLSNSVCALLESRYSLLEWRIIIFAKLKFPYLLTKPECIINFPNMHMGY